jgi:molybdate transport system ATP-binding protein
MTLDVRFHGTFGDFTLEVAFQAPGRGITALFGHSGSGKTTLLRCMAGLERAEGSCVINGEVWQESGSSFFLPTHRRPLGYVFQEASLFSHLDVRANLEYGMKRVSSGERRVVFEQAVELLGLEALLERGPARLSGGERQRVAMARALLTSPKLLMMDEPLSALDEKSKLEILPYLEKLHSELAIPVIYVSHSTKEVARLADEIVWLDGGRVKRIGSVGEILARMDFAAAEDAGAVLETHVSEHDELYHLTALDSGCGRLWVRRLALSPGAAVRVRLPAREISLGLEPESRSSILNEWQLTIAEFTETEPGQMLVRLEADDPSRTVILARITARSWVQLGLRPGMRVFARIKSVALLNE